MRAREILATVAVTGAVAAFALLNFDSIQSGRSFLATPITEAEREFINFISTHHRSYGTKEEYEYRLSLFADAFKHIQETNSQDMGFKLAVNQFSDFNTYEYKQMLGFKQNPEKEDHSAFLIYDALTLPTSIDWVAKGAVTGVKNQGSCGSCWTFSASGALEGLHFVKTGSLLSFSEQQIVDCDTGIGGKGCNGGSMDFAFKYAEKNKMELESDYPYTGKDGTCQYSATKGKFSNTGYVDVKPNSPSDFMAALANQPVSVAIEADQRAFQSYSSGIIAQSACGTNLDHGVLAVGYGTDNGQDYYKVKNSWGTTWGEKGYFRVARSSKSDAGTCGIQAQPSYPTA